MLKLLQNASLFSFTMIKLLYLIYLSVVCSANCILSPSGNFHKSHNSFCFVAISTVLGNITLSRQFSFFRLLLVVFLLSSLILFPLGRNYSFVGACICSNTLMNLQKEKKKISAQKKIKKKCLYDQKTVIFLNAQETLLSQHCFQNCTP